MEQGICLPEEHRIGRRDGDGCIYEIDNFKREADMFFLAELYWAFCNLTMGEDVSGLKTFEGNGETFTVTEAEARIYAYLHTGHQIKVAYYNNVMAGFLISQPIFANLYAIKSMFTEPWCTGTKLGKQLVSSLQEKPFKILFKTLKANPPEKCLIKTSRFRSKITEDNDSITWMMDWGEDGNCTESSDGRQAES